MLFRVARIATTFISLPVPTVSIAQHITSLLTPVSQSDPPSSFPIASAFPLAGFCQDHSCVTELAYCFRFSCCSSEYSNCVFKSLIQKDILLATRCLVRYASPYREEKMSNRAEATHAYGESICGQIPPDFPRQAYLGVVPRGLADELMTEYEGHLYSPGCSPLERFEHWKFCEELAKQLVEELLEFKAGFYAYMSETQALNYYLPRLVATRWTSEVEARWIVRRTAELLNWNVPNSV